jgi:hypothetical protein
MKTTRQKTEDNYRQGQRFFNPKTREVWIVYYATFNNSLDEWEYRLIQSNENEKIIKNVLQSHINNRIKTGTLKRD